MAASGAGRLTRRAFTGARNMRGRMTARTPRTGQAKSLVITRSSIPYLYSLTAGALNTVVDPALSYIQYSDLTGVYDRFKILSVEALITPNYDPGQSGVTNNSIIALYLACDPGQHYTTPTVLQTGAFDNHKVFQLVAGKTYRYRFTPKAANALAAGNLASTEDWLFSSASGAGVGHSRLCISAVSQNASDVLGFTIVYRMKVAFRGVY